MDVFGGAPRFLAYPRPVVVQSGTDAVLKCQIGGDPRPAVIWERNNEKIDAQGRYRVFEDGNVYNLIISAVTTEDSGQYICKAKNSIGETYAAATLKVEGEAQEIEFREENKPRFLIKPLSTRVGRGEDAVFSCKLWGNPRPEVVWEKDGRKLNEIFESTHFSVGYQDGGWFQLKIFKTRAPDGGVYTCKARNEFGEALAGAVLLVDAGPGHEEEGNRNGYTNGHWKAHQGKQRSGRQVPNRLKDETMTKSTKVKMFAVTEGKHAKFRCFVTGKPKPEIIWRKDGRLILSGRRYLLYEDREGYFTLKVLYCKQKDNGVYVCAASNTAGQTLSAVHLSVKEPPVRFKQPLIDLEVWERDLAVLECEVPEDSVPITWYLEDRRLQPGAKYGMEEWGTKRRLTIRDIGVDDDGIYLCEMPDGGRSIAEVAVKGTILRKLPRKVDVLEGENAAFCVEVEKEEMDIHWYKDGVELRETHQTILKSFGRTHILVFVNTMPQDSGLVIFLVGRSKTSSQLRVKAARHCPPSCPVSVQINTERANAALLSWVPAQDSRKNPPSGYVLERQEVGTGSQEWLQCLTTDSATSVEILGDSVPCEADYRFRICSLNKYGKSNNVEFPRAVHLVPVARIQAPLQDALVPEGQDALFSIELSASVIGTWFLNGTQLQEDERYSMRRSRTHQSLRIRGVRDTDNGAEITFIAYGIRDSAAMYIQAPLVKFSPLSEMDRNKFVEIGNPIVLYCELSDPAAPVHWYKNGMELQTMEGLHIQSEGTMRRIVIQSAEFSHSGVYCCDAIDDVIRFNVEVEAPPVTFADIPEEDLFKSVVEQEQLVLSCEVSRADGVVQWYKDGTEMQPRNNITMQAEGTKRNLTIHSAQLSDTGTYTCRAGDNVLMFKVNIREPPVMIIYPKEDVHLDRHVPEEIILSCELSRPNGFVSWYKDGQKLQESENIKLKIEGPYRRLKILSCGVEDSGEYVCDTADDSIFFHLSITEPPVLIVSPSQSQMELCQQTSERMVLSCEISRPNAVVRWYRDGLEVEENDNLILEVDGVYRRLIIPEATVKDSAEYVCDTADDSMTFFVNIAEPPVRFIRPRKMASRVEKVAGESLVLDCEVSRSNAEVTWKKNGEEVEDSRNITILEDGVMRQLTIHSLSMECAGQYVCDAKDDVMDFDVKVQELPVKIIGKTAAKIEKQFLVSDDIILVCELSRSNASVSWYKDNQLIDDTERYCSEEQGVFRSLVVLNAGLEDSGEYICDAVDDKMLFYITVKEPPVQIIGNSGHPEHHILVAGDDLILECEVSRPNATVQWLWNGEILKPDTRIKIDSHDVVRKLVLSGLQPSDSGKYICDAIDDKLITVVEVQEPPVKFVNKKARNNVSGYENESVTLCATVSQDRANVRWLKDGQLLNGDNIHISSEGNTHKLTINPLQLSDSGEYVCDANTDEMYFSLLVKEMTVKFIRPLENIVSLKGSSLILRCEINKPKGDVQWLKDGNEISPSRRHTIRAQGRERSFTIHQLVEEDAGEYACESTDDRTSATVTVETPRVLEFIAELRNITVCEGEDAVFKCVVSPEDTQLVWRLNGKQVALNERSVISSNGLCHMLCIHNCMLSDSGRVTADAEGLVSEAELQVQEQQVVFTKKMTPVVAEEYSEATLEVEVSLDSGEVQWMRQGMLIHPGAKYTLKHKGRKHSLTIHKLAMSDRGTYSCETLHDRMQAQLTVEPRKITIERGLTDIKTTERETTSFEVELSHPNVPGTWLRNGIQLKSTNHFRMSAKGQVHSLTISNLSVEDTGTFMFCVENLKTSARLVVKEPPVTIFRKLEDQKFPEGAVISIECELSRHNVDVKWMKNGVEVKPGKDLRIYAMGRKRFLQIMKCHVSDSGMYTCDAGDATTSCTVEVYERELLTLQGLEDLDIQEDQNAVFVCEISVEDVQGEWYKNGERIQPTSTIKIRQEGTKHFLLMCNVRAEDSGEIKFVARHVESVAYLEVEELPVSIVKPLQDKTVLEKSRVILDCTVSNPRCSIRWYKGSNVILPSERFEICSEGCYRKLIIQQVALHDEGMYSVQVGEYTCSAKLTVEAQSLLMVRELKDVEVMAPDEACFECEVSVPVLKAPVWSLNGEALQPSSRVLLEKMGTVHRLTLRQTSPDMNGAVEFTSGKATSRAQLRVLSDP
ncbi:obscurin-like protein 1 isoform X10 [Siniperca chuatsi]|uniref:obscurin-like protein 1 isoform X10 n=1 Tax=Siniperca chuatsi TaxID=119488 RepID=UPI001CE0EEF3|nr:obscurin-like protein 1 isoform X10 [Siniperca chuatsi]